MLLGAGRRERAGDGDEDNALIGPFGGSVEADGAAAGVDRFLLGGVGDVPRGGLVGMVQRGGGGAGEAHAHLNVMSAGKESPALIVILMFRLLFRLPLREVLRVEKLERSGVSVMKSPCTSTLQYRGPWPLARYYYPALPLAPLPELRRFAMSPSLPLPALCSPQYISSALQYMYCHDWENISVRGMRMVV